MPPQRRHEVEARLARVEGHAHAVHRMAHEGRSYREIAVQVLAIRSALDAALQVMVDDLIEDFVRAGGRRSSTEPAARELKALVSSAF